MILVTGASGNAGGSVLKEVLKTNQPVSGMYRSPEDAGKAPEKVRAVIADFADRPSLGRALEGVDTVYLVCSPVRELVGLEGNMLDACQAARVRHIVLNSAMGAGDYPKSFQAGTARWRISSRRRASDLQFFGRTASCKTS